MTFKIREFNQTDADYMAGLSVWNAAWPDNPATIDEWKHYDATRDKRYWFHSEIIEVDGVTAGFANMLETFWSPAPGKYMVRIAVHPNYRRQGIATAWYDHALKTIRGRPQSITQLFSETREDQDAAIRFLEKRGFKMVLREPVSKLDVTAFDAAPFAATIARSAAAGIRITTLTELSQTDPDWQRKFWELDNAIMADVPAPDEFVPKPLDVYVKSRFEHPAFLPSGCYVALDGDDYIGMSCLWADLSRSERLYTGLSGVRRGYRRQGIVTAIKVQSIEQFAKSYGATVIETDNEENNPMYQINLRLGFQPAPAGLFYQKDFDDDVQDT